MNAPHHVARVATYLLLAGMTAASGCGGGGGSSPSPTPGNTMTNGYTPTTSPPAPAPTPAPTPTPAPSSAFAVTSLVADSGPAAHTDPNLKNGWGVAFNPVGFVWVADNGTSMSTLYDGNGVPQSLVVTLQAGKAGAASPTGIVFNPTQDFVLTRNGASGASAFLFAGEGGTISAWSPAVDMTTAFTVFDGSNTGKIYKGLALAGNGNANFLYAADFHNKKIDVFDLNFAPVSLPGNFTDPSLPSDYAPYGIQAIGNSLYISYAKQDAQGEDEIKGAGLGIVDVFDSGGAFVRRLAAGGALNAPWGMAMAPAGFGSFSGDLLIANFGDGRINAFDPTTGAMAGTLSTGDGMPIAIDGLWGIAFGNGINNQPMNTLFFAAGPSDETHGLYGRIDLQ